MNDRSGPETEARALLRAAADELLPVIVDLGPDQARFSSFIVSFEEDAGARIVLDPVAAEALPERLTQPLRIVPAVPNAGWSVMASTIRKLDAHRACVELAHARVLPSTPDEGALVVQATDLLVLVIPGGLHGASSYVFPVQRIGADVCEIRSNVALEPGRELPCVELVGDRRLLRRASAQVLETIPWYAGDGNKSFTCRLGLRDELAVDPSATHDLVTEPAEVRRLLEMAGMIRAPGWFEAPGWGRGALTFLEVGQSEIELDLETAPGAPLPLRGLRVGVELFATAYELDVRPLGFTGARLRTSVPLILRRRRRHRRDQRTAVDPALGVTLSFRNPVTGTVETRSVTEASFFAVSFDSSAHSSVLWCGLPLEQAQLCWGGRLVHVGDLVVEEHAYDAASGRTLCVAAIRQSSIADDPDMIALMATLAHPQVRTHDGDDFSALHQIYLKAGLFGPHMHRNLGPIFEETAEVFHRAHSQAQEVVRTFVYGPEAAPDAAVTLMRAWEHGWLLQHFVDASPDINGATGRLQAAYLDHLVLRPDGRYLVFFVKTDNRMMNAYLQRFFSTTGTPDAVSRSLVELWSRPADAVVPDVAEDRTTSIRGHASADEPVLARAVQRQLGLNAAAALSMIPGEIELHDTRARFARAGLERARKCDIVFRSGASAYAIFEERSSPGLNLTWMLNASWIVPVHIERDQDGSALHAALREVVARPAQAPTGEHFLIVPEGTDNAALELWGFHKEASIYLYVLTRAGLHRFLSYATRRYGELDAMTVRRERRRVQGE
jgi:hypothetical protein